MRRLLLAAVLAAGLTACGFPATAAGTVRHGRHHDDVTIQICPPVCGRS